MKQNLLKRIIVLISGNEYLLDLLLQSETNVNIQNLIGNTPSHFAVRYGQTNIKKKFKKIGIKRVIHLFRS